jgi:hypothetical protein
VSVAGALLGVALQAAAPPPAWVEGEWLTVHDGPIARIDLDESATQREGDRVRARIRADMPSAVGGVRWSLTRLEIDCRGNAMRGIELIEYRIDGSVFSHATEADASPMARAPDEEIRGMLAAICHRTGWGEEGVDE